MQGVMFVLVLTIALGIYCGPSLIAWHSRAKHGRAIIVLNLMFGWTVIGWIVALIWALAESEATWPKLY